MIDVPTFHSASKMLVEKNHYRPFKNFESLEVIRILMFYQLKFMKIRCHLLQDTVKILVELTFLLRKC